MTLSSKRPLLYFFFGLLLIAAAADTYLYLCTAYAPWGFSDSAAYFSAARNLAQGTGLGVVLPQGDFVRLEVFAPFYSIMLSPFAGANLDLIAVSRWMNLILFAGLTIGCGWLFFRVTRSYAAGLLFAILLGTTPALASAYSSMMSEPLACAPGFPALLLSMAAARENSMKLLLGAAFLSALALFTRYAFLAVPVAGLLIWFLFGSGGPKQRWLGALGFSLLSFVPTGVWVGIGLLQRQTIGTRVFAFPDSLTREITEMAVVVFNVVKYWLPYRSGMIPGLSAKIASPVLIAFFLGLTLFSLFAPGRKSAAADPSAARLVVLGALIFAAAYLGVLFIAYAFSGMLDLNERTLMPLLPALYLLLLSAALFVERSFRFKVSLPWIQVMIVLFFVGYNLHFWGIICAITAPIQKAMLLRPGRDSPSLKKSTVCPRASRCSRTPPMWFFFIPTATRITSTIQGLHPAAVLA